MSKRLDDFEGYQLYDENVLLEMLTDKEYEEEGTGKETKEDLIREDDVEEDELYDEDILWEVLMDEEYEEEEEEKKKAEKEIVKNFIWENEVRKYFPKVLKAGWLRYNDHEFELFQKAVEGTLTPEVLENAVSEGLDLSKKHTEGIYHEDFCLIDDGSIETREFIIKSGVDLSSYQRKGLKKFQVKNDDGNLLFFLSAVTGNLTPELLDTFKKYGIDLNSKISAIYKNVLVSRSLFHKRFLDESSLESVFCDYTALMFMARRGNRLTKDLLLSFIKNGTDLNARNTYGETALMIATTNPCFSSELLDVFVNGGADINARDEAGNTALMHSVSINFDKPKRCGYGPKDAEELGGWGTVHYIPISVAGHLTPELLDAFIAHGADINAQDVAGMTALMHIISTAEYRENNRRFPLFKLLEAFKKHGADINIRDFQNNTALMYAVEKEDELFFDILKIFKEDIKPETVKCQNDDEDTMTSIALFQDIETGFGEFDKEYANKRSKYRFMVKLTDFFVNLGFSVEDIQGCSRKEFAERIAEYLKSGGKGKGFVTGAFDELIDIAVVNAVATYPERCPVTYDLMQEANIQESSEINKLVLRQFLLLGSPDSSLMRNFLHLLCDLKLKIILSDKGEDEWKQDSKKCLDEYSPHLISALLGVFDSDPGVVVEYVKLNPKEIFEYWIYKQFNGAEELMAKLLPYFKGTDTDNGNNETYIEMF